MYESFAQYLNLKDNQRDIFNRRNEINFRDNIGKLYYVSKFELELQSNDISDRIKDMAKKIQSEN
jgi:hypothetical protein